MKLLEFEAKHILETADIPVPASTLLTPRANSNTLDVPVVIKSQVPVGGRGKAGGVRVVDNKEQLESIVSKIFSLPIQGYIPHVLLAEEKIEIKQEHYLSLLIDRDTECIRLLVHKEGGINIENHAKSEFLSLPVSKKTITEDAIRVATYLGYPIGLVSSLLYKLFDVFIESDAVLLEINPLIYTASNTFVCGDCKMELDDAAAFRHPEWHFTDSIKDANFVTLDDRGNIGTIANGAGLAMATVDAVAAHKMTPANFLDIGGGANAEAILRAFQRMNTYINLKAIVINIFAGITRCDEVARAIIAAKEQIASLPPLYIRLAGTNFEEAVMLLSEANITTLSSLEECLVAAERHL